MRSAPARSPSAGPAYVVSFAGDFGINIPAQFVSAPYAFDAAQPHLVDDRRDPERAGGAIVVVVTSACWWSASRSPALNDVIVVIKLIVIVLFIVCAAPAFDTANWVTSCNPADTFIPPNAGPGV